MSEQVRKINNRTDVYSHQNTTMMHVETWRMHFEVRRLWEQ